MWGILTAKVMPSICCQSPWPQWLDLVSVMTKWVLSWPERWEQEGRWKVGNLFCRYWLLKAPLLVWWPYFISNWSQRAKKKIHWSLCHISQSDFTSTDIGKVHHLPIFTCFAFQKCMLKLQVYISQVDDSNTHQCLVFLKHVEDTARRLLSLDAWTLTRWKHRARLAENVFFVLGFTMKAGQVKSSQLDFGWLDLKVQLT